MFALLQKHSKPVSTERLVIDFWKNYDTPPYNSRVSAMASLRSLRGKMEHNDEACVVVLDRVTGPKPSLVWIEKRQRRKSAA